MDRQYLEELFSFQIAHTKYSRQIEHLFTFEPAPECPKTLTGYGLHYKNTNKGFIVAAPVHKSSSEEPGELINPFGQGTKLSFAVFTTDPHFFEYSGLTADSPGESVIYVNNLGNKTRYSDLLTGKAGLEDSEKTALRTKQISGNLEYNGETPVMPTVKDCHGNQLEDPDYKVEIDTIKNIYTVDLEGQPDGLYTITYGTKSLTCYCCKASFIRRIPLVILEIFTGPGLQVPEELSIIKIQQGKQIVNGTELGLQFGTIEKFYWRYEIIPCIRHWLWVQVSTGHGGYTFSPEKIGINKWHEPAVFTSTGEIDTDPQLVEPRLLRFIWNNQCHFNDDGDDDDDDDDYKYCGRNYGIHIDGQFMCRHYKIKNSKKVYEIPCPARGDELLIDNLPLPGEIETSYYEEDGKKIAHMKLYLIKYNGKYIITDDLSKYPGWDGDED